LLVTDDRARKKAIRARMAATGEPYTVAARALDATGGATGPVPTGSRIAIATVTLDGHRWRITTSDGSYPESRGGTMGWRDGVPLTDRVCFLEQVGRELAVHGWDITGPDLPDPVPPAVELALVRNERGRDLDEVERLHREAGVDYHSAHDAYVEAVAAAVAATGMVIHDITADGGEPREGWFALGEDPDSGDEEDDAPVDGPVSADVIVWRDETGWYHLHYRDRNAVHGDGPYALPGLYGLTPPPHEVAAAVLRAFPLDGAAEPQPWPTPAGYDPNPPPAPDDGFSVSAALERSLVAYAPWTTDAAPSSQNS
jgi:hypothetical protein